VSTEEAKVKSEVKKVLKEHGVYWHMPVQTGMGAPSLDFICCHHGKYLAIETKKPGGKPTPRQETTMASIEKAGGKTMVIDGDMSELIRWLGDN
jgi:hypothetical protein